MLNHLVCGNFHQEEEYEAWLDSPRRSRKSRNKNPYSTRGLDQFSALLADLDRKRKEIYSQTRPQDISFIRFVSSKTSCNDVVPIVIKVKDKQEQKSKSEELKVRHVASNSQSSQPILEAPKQSKSASNEIAEKRKEENCCKTMWRRPSFYVPLMLIMILGLLTVFGRSVATICTCMLWYAASKVKDRSSSRKAIMKRKRYTRGLSEKAAANSEDMDRSTRKFGRQKSWYVGVGESEDVQLFYYFVKSQRNPKQDPILLWLTGGPGCSALSSLLFEIGPLHFRIEQYNGTLPTLVLNPDSWAKISSIIFLDLPAHTGFSYTTLPIAPQRSDSKQIQHALQFFRKWLTAHPEFHSNPIYIGGDSYSEIIVPAVAVEISKGNENSIQPSINFQGYLLGNPSTDKATDNNYKIPFAHGMGLISDELYESLKSSCRGEYQNVDPSNKLCAGYIAEYEKCVSGINTAHVLETTCPFVSPKPQKFSDRRSLDEMPETLLTSDPQPSLPPITCRAIPQSAPLYEGLLAQYWANDGAVRKALGIRRGSIGKWVRCISSPYAKEIESSVPFHVNLSAKVYRALIYSGDHDLIVPFGGTPAWIRSLNYSIVDEWRRWFLKGQVAGYTRTYSNGMTYATIKGGGHTAPEYKPKECFAMFERWISRKPL